MTVSRRKLLLLAPMSVATIIAGIVFQLSAVFYLGAGAATDAFFVAQIVPVILSSMPISALTNTITPMLAGLDASASTSLARQVLRKMALPVLTLASALALTAGAWLPLMFGGLDDVVEGDAVTMARIFCAVAVFNLLASVSIARLHARSSYVMVEATQLLLTILAVAAVPLALDFGIVGFAVLVCVRAALTWLATSWELLLPSRGQDDVVFPVQLWSRVWQLASGAALFKLGPVIDRILASFATAGTVSTLGVGQQAVSALCTLNEKVAGRPLLVAVGASVGGGEAAIEGIYLSQLKRLLLVVAVLLAGIIPLVALYFEVPPVRTAVEQFGNAGLILAMVLTAVPTSIGQLSASVAYALGEVKAITVIAVSSFLFATCLKIFGFLEFGAYAIVAGIFLYQSINFVGLHVHCLRVLQRSQRERAIAHS